MEAPADTPEFLQLKARIQEGGENFIKQIFAGMNPAGMHWLVKATQAVAQGFQGADQDIGAMSIAEFHAVLRSTERSLASGVSIDGGPAVAPPVNVTALRAVVEFYITKHGPSDEAWNQFMSAIRVGHTAQKMRGKIPVSAKAPGTTSGRAAPQLSSQGKQVLNPTDFALLTGRPSVKAWLILLLYLGIGVAIGLRGVWAGTAIRLVIAAPVAIVALFFYVRLLDSDAADPAPRRSWRRAFSAAGAMPAYLVGCYLVFLEGFGGAWALLRTFSISSLLWSLVAIFLGYKLVYHTWLLTELGEGVRTGRIRTDASLPRTSP